MSAYLRRAFSAFLLSLILASVCHAQEVFFREDFTSLQNWRSVSFPQVHRQTTYTIESKHGERYLKSESDASASALVYKGEFDVYEFSRVRWCWKVDTVYQKCDPEKKSGDDYPIRVQIAFKYDPEKASTLKRIEYALAKKMYGEYPPISTLSYAWASREDQKTILASPFSDTVRVIALEKGSKQCGIWREEEIDIVKDYREAFGVDPPHIAGIIIMNDSDDTGQKSVSYVRFLEISKRIP